MLGINEQRVTSWFVDNIEGALAPFEFSIIAGGHSNLTYRLVGADGRAFVLRRPPLGHVLATAHDMEREHRIVSAVGQTNVPVARCWGLCTDVEVNEAPFYVMNFVEGVVLDNPDKAVDLAPDTKRALAFALVDVLADLHAVDVDAIGLGNLAKRDGYVERQVKRWSTQWDNSKTREIPAIEELKVRLRDGIPEQQGVSIAHGDYRFGNCMIDLQNRKIAAVLDWELCTLGDPLADLGYIGVYWSDPGIPTGRANDPTSAGGFPAYSELVARYAQRTGRDVSKVAYYKAFSSFRLAVISEGVYARYLHGVMGHAEAEVIEQFKVGPENLANAALAAVNEL